MRLIYFVLFGFILSCTTSQQALFAPKSPHEQYADHITNASLSKTVMGRSWLNAATRALQQPLSVTLPYQEAGYFASAETDAQGYRFNARRGEQVVVTLTRNDSRNVIMFLDLWELAENTRFRLLASLDTASNTLQYEVKKDGTFFLRLQPELLASVDYKLIIITKPSLNFPVAMAFHPKIGSFWGAGRDAGARSHEGIDIFGAFRTPVIAAADGLITSVTLNRLGGKVVFMRPYGKDYSLYYAHLDSQLVEEGQRVRTGDTLGLMGNTGNAKNTPTHLHFGLYASGGAVDPLPFVNQNRPEPSAINAGLSRLKQYVRCNKSTVLNNATRNDASKISTIQKNTIVQVKAATGDWYKVLLPDEMQGYLPAGVVGNIDLIRTITVTNDRALLDKPDSIASMKSLINKGSKVPLLGRFGSYYYVEMSGERGWMKEEGK